MTIMCVPLAAMALSTSFLSSRWLRPLSFVFSAAAVVLASVYAGWANTAVVTLVLTAGVFFCHMGEHRKISSPNFPVAAACYAAIVAITGTTIAWLS